MDKRLLPTIALLLVFVAFVLQRDPATEPPAPQDDTAALLRSNLDYFLDGMIMDNFLPDGTHSYRIDSDRVTHYPGGDISLLEQPKLNWHESGKPSWRMTARSGVLRPDLERDTDNLLLQQDVLAIRHETGRELLRISSNSLTVLPEYRELSTEERVLLNRPGLTQQSDGMHADLNRDQITLYSGTGTYHEQGDR